MACTVICDSVIPCRAPTSSAIRRRLMPPAGRGCSALASTRTLPTNVTMLPDGAWGVAGYDLAADGLVGLPSDHGVACTTLRRLLIPCPAPRGARPGRRQAMIDYIRELEKAISVLKLAQHHIEKPDAIPGIRVTVLLEDAIARVERVKRDLPTE
jgi:hypothetical protein